VGLLDDWVTRNTITSDVHLFFATWQRYSGKVVDKETRVQGLAYLNSPEFASVCLLSTKARKKPIASSSDAEVIVRQMWKDKKYFKTNRYVFDCSL
jgi:hypothetical protein